MSAEYSEAALARSAVATAARALSQDAQRLTDTAEISSPDQMGAFVEWIDQLIQDAERLKTLTVIYARENRMSWTEIGNQMHVTRQSAHERFASDVTAWREQLQQAVAEQMGQLDGSEAARLALLTGLSREDIEALGGVDE